MDHRGSTHIERAEGITVPELKAGDWVNDKYEVMARIGAGAHGTVYRAIQHPVMRTVALKFISRHLSRDSENRERFFDEARALARLNHPNVVTLYDYGESGGRLYMAMELIEGEELTAVIEREKPMHPVRATRIAEQVLRALIEAHEIGLVHRDLKPANIMVYSSPTGEDRVKVLDLGIASLREDTGLSISHRPKALGTPGYCAPEQCLGRPVGPSADLYAVGVILFEMLSGKRPYDGPNAWMIIERHLNESIPMLARDLNIPPALESTVRLALAKRPEARFPDARSMLARLLENLAPPGASDSYEMPTLRELDALDDDAIQEIAARIQQRRSQPDYSPPAQDTSTVHTSDHWSPSDSSDPILEMVCPRAMTLNKLPARPNQQNPAEFNPSLWLGVTVHGLLFLVVGLMLSVFSTYS